MAKRSKKKPSTRNSPLRVKRLRSLVVVGSSAGGLEALRTLFSSLGKVESLGFVVVQHLAPQHRSRMVELISHATSLKVRELRHGDSPEAGVIYITPPNKDVVLRENILLLRKPHAVGPKPSVDDFFASVAEDCGSSAVGIILSGTGSDGSQGIRKLKAAGALTIAQKVETAKYDGMPKAAYQTGAIDLVLGPEQIALELRKLDNAKDLQAVRDQNAANQDPFARILSTLERNEGINFAEYKPSTIRRRIERRRVATSSPTLSHYVDYLAKHPAESTRLFEDILISVTSFFRDFPAYKSLDKRLQEYLTTRNPGDFRAWVAGCATGEEAYSMAILLNEAFERTKKNFRLHLFATDLDEKALDFARRGIYPEASLRSVPKALRQKYFVKIDDKYQVRASLRESIVFARHNLVSDPPFLKLDLLSCRNVLIYFGAELQERVFKTFHYSIARGGMLFLGKSEAVTTGSSLFELVDKSAKIFRRNLQRAPSAFPVLSTRESHREAAMVAHDKKEDPRETPSEPLLWPLIAKLAPNSILVDENAHVKHIFGEASSLLILPSGVMTHSLTRLLPKVLGQEVGTLLHKASTKDVSARGLIHEVKIGRRKRFVEQRILPLEVGSKSLYLICFDIQDADPLEEIRSPRSGKGQNEDKARKYQRELEALRDHLQTVLEEQEASSEELQALNEELQSTNEELQSSNEELETTNEELQSSNEELTTLNQELNVKSSELQALNQRLRAIQAAISYPLLTLDRSQNLVNFNAGARKLLKLSAEDRGQHVRALPAHEDFEPVTKIIDRAYGTDSDQNLQFLMRDRSFEVQVQLFRDPQEKIEGAVVSFVDNTDITRALSESRLSEAKLASILENSPMMATIKDLSGVFTYVNSVFAKFVGKAPQDLVGMRDEEIFNAEVAEQLRANDLRVMREQKSLNFEEHFPSGDGSLYWNSSKFPLFDERGRVASVCTLSLDITERIKKDQNLKLLERAITSSRIGTVSFRLQGAKLLLNFSSGIVEELLRVPPKELEQISVEEFCQLFKSNNKGLSLREIKELLLSEASFNILFRPPQGEADQWFEARSTLEVSRNASRGGYLSIIFVDASQRVRDERLITAQQDELARFSRFSALGEIAAGLGHEINTPLNVIITKTDLLTKLASRKQLDGEKVAKVTADIHQMVHNISSVVQGLKSVAGADPERFEDVDLRRVVLDTLKICEYRIHRVGGEFRVEVPEHEVKLKCNPVQIAQILINLINNAIDAIQEREDRWIAVNLAEHRKTVELRIVDSGPGIDPSLAEKIMTPFFTTKKDSKGTGIGLSLSRSIARNHKGDLSLVPGKIAKNTTFKLELPRILE
jgi:two-component system CheB/CheR fusion protein